MGTLALIISSGLFAHAGALIERRKNIEINKKSMLACIYIEWLLAIYFLISGVGHFSC